MKILITGANGFVGRNLSETLKAIKEGKDKTRDIIVDDIFLFDINSMKEIKGLLKHYVHSLLKTRTNVQSLHLLLFK